MRIKVKSHFCDNRGKSSALIRTSEFENRNKWGKKTTDINLHDEANPRNGQLVTQERQCQSTRKSKWILETSLNDLRIRKKVVADLNTAVRGKN